MGKTTSNGNSRRLNMPLSLMADRELTKELLEFSGAKDDRDLVTGALKLAFNMMIKFKSGSAMNIAEFKECFSSAKAANGS